jgi:hypothetical protein
MGGMKTYANLGRGAQATTDMKLRIAALRDDDRDIIEVLWTRHALALAGGGYVYEFAEARLDPHDRTEQAAVEAVPG